MNDTTELPTRRRLRFGLSTFLLFVTAVAIWLAGVPVARQTEELKQQLPGLRRIARELVVTDPAQFAAVGRTPTRLFESICDVFVPSGDEYELCLALEKINDQGIAEPVERMPLPAGTHAIEVRQDKNEDESRITILVDGKLKADQRRPERWSQDRRGQDRGSSGGLSVNECATYPPDEPLVLFRKRFMVATSKTTSSVSKRPENGILVWIEKRQEGSGDVK